MIRRALPVIFLLILLAVHLLSLGKLAPANSGPKMTENPLYVLPSPIMKIAALDFDNVVSDFLFIEGLVYIGSNFQYQSNTLQIQLTDSQWKWFYDVLDISSDLDPYFVDPYYIANSFLTWESGMVREANVLLEKGSRYRDWDWTLPFFIGFNYFYFLQENDKAAESLMEAARRPGASETLASLASKLAFKANRTESSILFLEEMARKSEDEPTKKLFEKRVEAYKAIFVLEKAVETYRRKFGRTPQNTDDLVKKKILSELPKDPYGGKFSIDAQGKVRTTSESLLMPYLKKKK